VPVDVPAPTKVLTLVFLAWGVGTVVLASWTRLWDEIHAGHFKVIWLVATGLTLASGFGHPPAWILTALCIAAYASIYASRDREVGAVTAVASLVILGLGQSAYGYAIAALMGTVTNAMLLGHWHLNQPRLGTKPIARLVWSLVGGLIVFATATALLALGSASVRLLGAVTAVAFTLFAGVLTAMVFHLVRTRSIMSATGILYLEILLCFVAAFTGSVAALAPV
ncbi:MAG: hypothetical protein ACRDKJ_14540, partial [Actinomycetota bacterium]